MMEMMEKVIKLVEEGRLQEAIDLLEEVCNTRSERGRCWTGKCKSCTISAALEALRKLLAA